MLERVSIVAGHGRNGVADAVPRIDLKMGDVVSVVGHTGSGKTTLINDIELFADRDTPSGRQILIDGQTREIVQDIYVRKVERKDGQLWNVEFDVQKSVKDPGKSK